LAPSAQVVEQLSIRYPDVQFLSARITNKQLVDAGMSCALTVYGTVAHEIAFLGVPVIACGDHPHIGFDFCYTAKTRDEYDRLVSGYKMLDFDREAMRKQSLAFYFMHNLDLKPEESDLLGVLEQYRNRLYSDEKLPGATEYREMLANISCQPVFLQHIQSLSLHMNSKFFNFKIANSRCHCYSYVVPFIIFIKFIMSRTKFRSYKFLIGFTGKRMALLLMGAILAMSILDLVGIAIIFPYLQIVSDPDGMLGKYAKWLGTLNTHIEGKRFLLLLSVGLILFYILKNYLQMRLTRYQFKSTAELTRRITDDTISLVLNARYAAFQNMPASEIVGIASSNTVHATLVFQSALQIVNEGIFLVLLLIATF